MTYPTTFANLAAGAQPLSLVDTMFQVVGQQGAIPCAVSGTANAITLTPSTNYYAPTALTNGLMCSFLATATNTAATTLQLLALGALNLYIPSGVQASSGRIVSGNHYIVQYWSDLNSSSGGWLIVSSTPNNNAITYTTAFSIGTFSATGSTTTPLWANGYLQFLTNNVTGATGLTIAAPTSDGAMLLQITNGPSGNIAATFTTGVANFQYTTAGDAYVTTTGAVFLANMWRINGTASYFLRRIL